VRQDFQKTFPNNRHHEGQERAKKRKMHYLLWQKSSKEEVPNEIQI